MLRLKNVTIYQYGKPVITDFNLESKKGEVTVLLGPDKSGKSELLKTIVDPLAIYDGDILVNHYNMKSESLNARFQVGYLPNPPIVEPHLTGFEFLDMIAAFYRISPNERQKKINSLSEIMNCKSDLYSTLSQADLGLRQKIGIMASLIHEPQILCWDEPLSNLDFRAQKTVIEIITNYTKGGNQVVIATDNLSFANTIADTYVVLKEGRLVAEGTLHELKNLTKTESLDIEAILSRLTNE